MHNMLGLPEIHRAVRDERAIMARGGEGSSRAGPRHHVIASFEQRGALVEAGAAAVAAAAVVAVAASRGDRLIGSREEYHQHVQQDSGDVWH